MQRGRGKGLPRTGGRSKGTPNKATQYKQMMAEVLASPEGRVLLGNAMRTAQQAPKGQQKAIETLRELMALGRTLVALNQPIKQPDGTTVLPDDRHEKLQVYLPIAVRAAAELAKYESPTFKAVAVQEVPPAPEERPGDGAQVVGSLSKRTQQDAAAVYMRLVRNDGKAA